MQRPAVTTVYRQPHGNAASFTAAKHSRPSSSTRSPGRTPVSHPSTRISARKTTKVLAPASTEGEPQPERRREHIGRHSQRLTATHTGHRPIVVVDLSHRRSIGPGPASRPGSAVSAQGYRPRQYHTPDRSTSVRSHLRDARRAYPVRHAHPPTPVGTRPSAAIPVRSHQPPAPAHRAPASRRPDPRTPVGLSCRAGPAHETGEPVGPAHPTYHSPQGGLPLCPLSTAPR